MQANSDMSASQVGPFATLDRETGGDMMGTSAGHPSVAKARPIWILEDDPGTVFTYSEGIEIDHQVLFFSRINELDIRLRDCTGANCPDLVIADLRLPDGSFLNYLEARGAELANHCPVLVVSSVDETAILKKCFAFGAVDYLTKPFSVSELRVKVERILGQAKRHGAGASFALTLDPRTFSAGVAGKVSPPLTQKEFQILALLNDAPNRTLKKATLTSILSGSRQVGPKALDVHLVKLRRKLASIGCQIHARHDQSIALTAEHNIFSAG